jgi:hypothetical protein
MNIVRSLGLTGLCILAGCNSDSGPALTPVSGTVTLGDQPFAGAQVKFRPQGETLGHGGTGTTGADGKYVIIANRSNNRKGLLPGEYTVIVSRYLMPDGSPLPPNTAVIDTGAVESVPGPYSKANLTPLKVTIGTEAKTFDVPLKKK